MKHESHSHWCGYNVAEGHVHAPRRFAASTARARPPRSTSATRSADQTSIAAHDTLETLVSERFGWWSRLGPDARRLPRTPIRWYWVNLIRAAAHRSVGGTQTTTGCRETTQSGLSVAGRTSYRCTSSRGSRSDSRLRRQPNSRVQRRAQGPRSMRRSGSCRSRSRHAASGMTVTLSRRGPRLIIFRNTSPRT
jgi:hypothetical protein